MRKVSPRVGKPAQAYRDTLSKASKADYKKLEKACIVAYLTQQSHVILALSYLTKLPDDFPPTVMVEKEGLHDYVKVKAPKLLRWLNDKGHSEVTAESLRIALFHFALRSKELSLES